LVLPTRDWSWEMIEHFVGDKALIDAAQRI